LNICVLLSRTERAVVYEPCRLSRCALESWSVNVPLKPRVWLESS
jgi:hypothetical protein